MKTAGKRITVYLGVMCVVSSAARILIAGSAQSVTKPGPPRVPSNWGTFTDGTNKFEVRFPPGWSVAIGDRRWLREEQDIVDFSPRENLPSFSVTIYPNPSGLSPQQWFLKRTEEADEGWGGRSSVIAEHPVTIKGQAGYAALMNMPDSKEKFVYLSWQGRILQIRYPRWWTSMTAYELKNYERHYRTQELMLQTFHRVD